MNIQNSAFFFISLNRRDSYAIGTLLTARSLAALAVIVHSITIHHCSRLRRWATFGCRPIRGTGNEYSS